MQLYDVYPRFEIEPVRGQGCYIRDRAGTRYLDLYGGHAVISIGHGHPHFVARVTVQLQDLPFYSNSVQMPIQQKLAGKLGELSGYGDYHLFLVNSGAEAVENALKLASFHTGRQRCIAFRGAFHGRTSAAVAVTDSPKIRAPLNNSLAVTFLPLNDSEALRIALGQAPCAAVIVEGIQGVGGVQVPEPLFLQNIRKLCDETGAVMILDEVQSGYGRSGTFFAHQSAGVRPDLITVAKGMGNGFPIGGVLIHPKFQAWPGQLGTTFGGNHLACAAGLAVLEVLEQENLIANAREVGGYLLESLRGIGRGIKEVRGQGLMIGIEMHEPVGDLRKKLLLTHHIFTGVSGSHTLRLLPPLCLSRSEAEQFLAAFAALVGA